MAKKKKITKAKKVVKLTDDEKEELKMEGELPKKSVREREDKQLIWFFIIVGAIFATVFIFYFSIEGAKTFEYSEIDWMIEDYKDLRIYHGQFVSLTDENLIYNIFLRNDPRENDISTEGTFDKFRYGGVVSFSPEVESCKGEMARVMLDLGGFLRQGVGVGPLEIGSTDESIASDNDRRFARCDTISDRTLIIMEIGTPSIVQNENNPYCYTITVEDCNDIAPVERFIVKSVEDFMEAKKALEGNAEPA